MRNSQWLDPFKLITDTVAKSPDKARPYILLGKYCLQTGDHEKALRAFDKVVKLKPQYPGGHFMIGNTFQKMGKLNEALKAYNNALNINPEYLEAMNNSAIVLAETGRYREAMMIIERHYNISNDRLRYLINRGNIFIMTQQPDSALALLEEAETMDSFSPQIQFNIGLALELKGNLPLARSYYKKALELDNGKYKKALDGLSRVDAYLDSTQN